MFMINRDTGELITKEPSEEYQKRLAGAFVSLFAPKMIEDRINERIQEELAKRKEGLGL